MPDLILIGAGGHARSCIDVIEVQGVYRIIGLLDIPEKIGTDVLGYPVISSDEGMAYYASLGVYFLNGLGQIGEAPLRWKMSEKLDELGARLATVISPLAHVAVSAKVGEGSIVMHHALVNACTSIGRYAIINSKALIEHDCIVGDACHVSTGAILNGGVVVGDFGFIGSHATVIQGVHLKPHACVKAGALQK